MGHFGPPGSGSVLPLRIRTQPTKMNADPDPQHCWEGRKITYIPTVHRFFDPPLAEFQLLQYGTGQCSGFGSASFQEAEYGSASESKAGSGSATTSKGAYWSASKSKFNNCGGSKWTLIRVVDSHTGGVEAQNGALEGLQTSNRRLAWPRWRAGSGSFWFAHSAEKEKKTTTE